MKMTVVQFSSVQSLSPQFSPMRQTNFLTLYGDRDACSLFTIEPDVLRSLSHGTDVAAMHYTVGTKDDNLGNRQALTSHQSRGSCDSGILGSSLYFCNSWSTLESTVISSSGATKHQIGFSKFQI